MNFFLFFALLFPPNFDEGMLYNSSSNNLETVQDRKIFSLYKNIYEKELLCTERAEGIPRILHFIWLGSTPYSEKSTLLLKQWRKKHPGWQIFFWTDNSRVVPKIEGIVVRKVEDFSFLYLKKPFEEAQSPAERSAILRCEILFREGGVYLDHDTECIAPIDPMNLRFDFYCPVALVEKTFLGTSVQSLGYCLAATLHHPILGEMLHWLSTNWEKVKDSFSSTDPEVRESRLEHLRILPLQRAIEEKAGTRDLVIPLRHLEKFIVHHSFGSWKEQEDEATEAFKAKLFSVKNRENTLSWILLALVLSSFFIVILTLRKKYAMQK